MNSHWLNLNNKIKELKYTFFFVYCLWLSQSKPAQTVKWEIT